jgi:hypothetical protein
MLRNILLPVDDSPAFEGAFTTALELVSRGPGSVQIDALYVLSVSKRKGRFLEDFSGMLGFEPVLVPERVEAWYREKGESLLQDVVRRIKGLCWTGFCITHPVQIWWLRGSEMMGWSRCQGRAKLRRPAF